MVPEPCAESGFSRAKKSGQVAAIASEGMASTARVREGGRACPQDESAGGDGSKGGGQVYTQSQPGGQDGNRRSQFRRNHQYETSSIFLIGRLSYGSFFMAAGAGAGEVGKREAPHRAPSYQPRRPMEALLFSPG